MFLKSWLACIALVAISAPTDAHEIYAGLKNRQGIACCDGTDCRPAAYRIKGGVVQMLIENLWFPIPSDVVEYRTVDGDTGESNGGHWCGKFLSSTIWRYEYLRTYCAFLPPNLM
jgi:hypothetical protein